MIGEGIFGIFGQGGSSLEKTLQYRVTKNIENKLARQGIKTILSSAGEGAEEIVTYAMNWAFDNIQDAILEEENKMASEWNWGEVGESFVAGAIAGGLSTAATNISNDIQASRGDTNAQLQQEIEQKIHDVEKQQKKAITESQEEQIGKIIQQGKQLGRNYTTQEIIDRFDMNEKSEKKIVDTLTSEQTTEGMTEEEISKLRTEIENRLEQGDINTTDIERILGEKEYKELEKAENLTKEIQELEEKIKNADENGIPVSEQKNLKQELEEKKNQLSEIDINKLRNDVLKSALTRFDNDSKIIKSYQERELRKQALEYDDSTYKTSEAKKTIANAKAIANNSTKTKNIVKLAAEIAEKTNTEFNFTTNEQLKKSKKFKKLIDSGRTPNGYVYEGGIVINLDSPKAMQFIIGHETTHLFENTKEYQEFKKYITDYANLKNIYKDKYESLKELYEGVERANIENELVADLAGEYLFTDQEFVNRLYRDNRKWYQKIYDRIKSLLKITPKGSSQYKELTEVQKH